MRVYKCKRKRTWIIWTKNWKIQKYYSNNNRKMKWKLLTFLELSPSVRTTLNFSRWQLETSWCWWLKVGDDFWMLVAEFWCWISYTVKFLCENLHAQNDIFIRKSCHCRILFDRSSLQGLKLVCIVWHDSAKSFHRQFFCICCKRLNYKAWASYLTFSMNFVGDLEYRNLVFIILLIGQLTGIFSGHLVSKNGEDNSENGAEFHDKIKLIWFMKNTTFTSFLYSDSSQDVVLK